MTKRLDLQDLRRLDTRMALATMISLFASREGVLTGMSDQQFAERLDHLCEFVQQVGEEQRHWHATEHAPALSRTVTRRRTDLENRIERLECLVIAKGLWEDARDGPPDWDRWLKLPAFVRLTSLWSEIFNEYEPLPDKFPEDAAT
jgi:hypothetical protein